MSAMSTRVVGVGRLAWLAAALWAAAPGEVLAQYVPGPAPPGYPQGPTSSQASAHAGSRLELIGLGGYQITSNVNTAGGTITVDGAVSYGAAMDLKLRPGYEAELIWIWSPTTAHFSAAGGGVVSTVPSDVDIHYFQIGGIRSLRSGIAEPFVAASLGLALISPGTVTFLDGTRYQPTSTWRMGFTLGLGLKIWLLDNPSTRVKVALRGDARFMAPIYFTSASFYGGSAGAAFAVSGGIPFVQGNFAGGLELGF